MTTNALPSPLPHLASWLRVEGETFVGQLLAQPGETDATWLRAWYRGFGGFHYAVVFSEPASPVLTPTITDAQPPLWDPETLHTGAIVNGLIAAAESHTLGRTACGASWAIRRDVAQVVLYINLE